jgi:glycerol-3-phosphate dehydrogenase
MLSQKAVTSVRGALAGLASRELDLLVIGGGILGAGVLRDAAMRGLRAALVDRGDFGAGTSSRSSRLIHGGLRYLEHRQWRFVREALRERTVLLRIAPHLVRPLPFVVPVHTGDRVPRWKLAAGLALYGALAAGRNVTRPRMFGKAGLLALEPNLRGRGLRGGGLYHDAQCDDARLVIATLRSALAHGAGARNYVEATGLVVAGGRVAGIEARDLLSGERDTLRARLVINATGPWADQVRRLERPEAPPLLRLTRGSHLMVRRSRLGHTRGITFTSAVDGRVMFVLPWGEFSYVGTTDTDHDGPPGPVEATPEDIRYLLRSVNALIPHARLGPEDVLATWCGLRALLAGDRRRPASSVTREHLVEVSPGGMITVAGGKLTTFRRIAAEVVDRAVRALGRGDLPPAPTDREPLPGGESAALEPFVRAGLDAGFPSGTVEHLVRHYGTETAAVVNLVREDRSLMRPIHPEHRAVGAEVVHLTRRELAVRVEDVLARRLRLDLETRDHGRAAALRVAELMGRELGWNAEQVQREAISFTGS